MHFDAENQSQSYGNTCKTLLIVSVNTEFLHGLKVFYFKQTCAFASRKHRLPLL
jgi:hypothetical protein